MTLEEKVEIAAKAAWEQSHSEKPKDGGKKPTWEENCSEPEKECWRRHCTAIIKALEEHGC